MLTSSNYDDDEKKVTGGRNGYGAKLANIFSTKFVLETADSRKKKHYKQTFRKNMSEKEEPEITSLDCRENYTSITFYPDLQKFRMSTMDDDIVSLFTKRAYDLAGVTNNKVKVQLNGTIIPIKNFDEYCKLYLDTVEARDLPRVIENKHERWEIIASLSDG